MVLAVPAKDGAGGEQFCLNTVTTSYTATAQTTTVVNTVVETVTGTGEDTVAYSSAAGETCNPIYTPICSGHFD